MAVIAGPRGTGNVSQTVRKPDWGDAIQLLDPDAAPLTVISRRANKKPTINPQYQWAEDDLDVRFAATSATVTNVATSVPVTTGQGVYFAQHDLVKVPRTGEVFRVTAVSTDTLTVVRGVGTSGTGQAMNSAEELLVLGSAQPEGDTSKPAKSSTVTTASNYTQIFRRPIELTETWRHSDTFFNQSDWDYQRGKSGIDHLKDIEEAFLFGLASEDTSGSQPRRTTGGAIAAVTANVTAAGGTMSESSFWAALRPAFRYGGSRRKTAFGSILALEVLNQYARSKVVVNDQGTGTYGVNMKSFQSTQGTLDLVTHYLLEGATYGGYLLILDMDNVKYRYLANSAGSRDSHIRENIQAPDADTRKDEWLAEVGIQVGQNKSHALITGVTG